jgi:hypothetical protein
MITACCLIACGRGAQRRMSAVDDGDSKFCLLPQTLIQISCLLKQTAIQI